MVAGETHDPDEREDARKVSRRWVVPVVPVAALAVLAVLAVSDCGPSYDKYDEVVRGTHKIPKAVNFGQRIGPDGDGCWVEVEHERVYCDLISIGGLHWDTGDVLVAPPVPVRLGSGHLCVGTKDKQVACWEWSHDIPPRRAPAPAHTEVNKMVGTGGFVCGQTPDYNTVVCWTVGVDQPNYRQATHRFTDGTEWHMGRANDDPPPRFGARQRDTGRSETFDAFSGEELSGPVEVPRLLETETTP